MQNHYCSLKTNRNVMLICLREKFAYDTTNESLSIKGIIKILRAT